MELVKVHANSKYLTHYQGYIIAEDLLMIKNKRLI